MELACLVNFEFYFSNHLDRVALGLFGLLPTFIVTVSKVQQGAGFEPWNWVLLSPEKWQWNFSWVELLTRLFIKNLALLAYYSTYNRGVARKGFWELKPPIFDFFFILLRFKKECPKSPLPLKFCHWYKKISNPSLKKFLATSLTYKY